MGGRQRSSAFQNENEPSADALNDYAKADFNNAVYRIVNPMLLETMDTWNPNRDSHTPDRLAGVRLIRLGVAMARGLAPGGTAAALNSGLAKILPGRAGSWNPAMV